MEPLKDTLQRTASAISTSIGRVFTDLENISRAVTAAAESTVGVPRQKDFLFVRKDLSDFINIHSDVIVGAGIAFAPGSLPEAQHWLEWWRAAPGGGPARFVTHDLNPDSLNYYDFTGREWFTLPTATGTPVAVGPYVDLGGINVNIITLCVPAPTPQGIHILGGDLTLAKLEGVFLRALQLREPSVILLGPNGRVIASNDHRIASGTLFHEGGGRCIDLSVDVSPDNPSRLPWKLVSLQPAHS